MYIKHSTGRSASVSQRGACLSLPRASETIAAAAAAVARLKNMREALLLFLSGFWYRLERSNELLNHGKIHPRGNFSLNHSLATSCVIYSALSRH